MGKFQEFGRRWREVIAGLRVENTCDICQLRDIFSGVFALGSNEKKQETRLTDLDLPHTKFTATRWLRSVKTINGVKCFLLENKDHNLVVQQLCSLQTHLT